MSVVSARKEYGGIPEWPKGADCKSVVTDFGGSNPPSPTRKKDLRKQVLFSTKFALRASEMRCAREILLRNVICLRVVSTRIESKTHIAEMIGVSPQSVSKWERGDTYPDITLLPALANLFKVLAILDKDMSQPEIEDAYLRFLHLGKKL